MADSEVLDLICRFVERSGGLGKVRAGGDALRQLVGREDQVICEYLSRISESGPASKQLVGAALLGFRLASFLYEHRQREEFRQYMEN